MTIVSRQSRIEGGVWGLLVGDALGVPYEFHHPLDLPPRDLLEMEPPLNFRRAHSRVPVGTWSDDGAQALVLLASLQKFNGLNMEDFGKGLVRWYNHGYMAVDGTVFDVGMQTTTAVRHLIAGVAAEQCGSTHEHANGNGALMRVLPLALWHQGTDAELVQLAHLQSKVTHGHLRSQVCCAFYCLWARYLLNEHENAWVDAFNQLRVIYGKDSAALREFDTFVFPDNAPVGMGSGYVVDTLLSVTQVMQESSYESVVKAAIALGHDTDTTACIAGGLAGIRDGMNAIPERWLDALRGKEMVEPLLQGLLVDARCVSVDA